MKEFIFNRDGMRVCVEMAEVDSPRGLAFVMHGLGGNKNKPYIQAMRDAFRELDYTVVTFDTTNTFGESDGKYEDATLTGYYQDLEDVISWASRKPWYAEPFILSGQSMGGISTGLYAQKNPGKVKALALIATLISGELSLQTPLSRPKIHYLDEWRRQGYWVSKRSNGEEKRLKWACMEDRLRYSLLTEADKLIMPTLVVVGDRDEQTPVAHQRMLFDRLPGEKEMHIVPEADHEFAQPQHQKALKALVRTWAEKQSPKTPPVSLH